MTTTYFRLSTGNFFQDWSDTSLITTNDDWSRVPSITGYLGDDIITATGVDPRTVLVASSGAIDVIANQTNPDTLTTGGVAEFETANPTIALNGSGTADAPSIVLYLDASGRSNVFMSLKLRDIDGSLDNSIQPIAVQYRISETADWRYVLFVPDASEGPSLATKVSSFGFGLPFDTANAATLQIRIITTNAVGNDEWIGIDDISVTSVAASTTPPGVTVSKTSAAVTEGGATDSFTVSLATQPSADVTVPVSVDTQVLTDVTSLVFTTSNWNVPQTVTIRAVDDTVVEGTHSGRVALGAAVSPDAGYNGLDPADVTVSITDNDVVLSLVGIGTVQGTGLRSPLAAQVVTIQGTVTARTNNGFWVQDAGDGDDATSDGIFVFTSSAPAAGVVAGAGVRVTGTVTEFLPGGSANNLTLTELTSPTVTVLGTGVAVTPTVIGAAGRLPPDGSLGSAFTTKAAYDAAIAFYESLEGMLVTVANAQAISGTNSFGETWVVSDLGARATGLNSAGGLTVTEGDNNPERIQIDTDTNVLPGFNPAITTGDRLGNVTGVVGYNFGNYEITPTQAFSISAGNLAPGATLLGRGAQKLLIAEYNVENLDPSDGAAKFAAIAGHIVTNLNRPDIVALQEIQDNNGATNDGTVSADVTLQTLVNAIVAAGGPTYQFAYISPVNNTSGGEPGGNIRNAFLYDPSRVALSSLGQVTDTAATTGDAFASSRIPLVGTFQFGSESVTLINIHSSSKGGSSTDFGAIFPPVDGAQAARIAQATEINAYVDGLLATNPNAKILVLGDHNAFSWEKPELVMRGVLAPDGVTPGPAVLFDMNEQDAPRERYTYNFDGNSQSLDHTLASIAARDIARYDTVHVNSEFPDATRVSDHDPSVTQLDFTPARAPNEVLTMGVAFQGKIAFPTGLVFDGTTVGGLSGLSYDAATGVFRAISDDRSPDARVYTLDIAAADGKLTSGDVTFTGVDFLKQADGTRFANLFLDPEAIAVRRDGLSYMTSEGDANALREPFVALVYPTGEQITRLDIGSAYTPVADKTAGIRNNLAFESLTLSPDGRTLWTATENALAQDGPATTLASGSVSRILKFDVATGQKQAEYAYVTDPIAAASVPTGSFATSGLVELLAIDDRGTLLAMERSFSVGVGFTVKLYEVRTQGATDISSLAGIQTSIVSGQVVPTNVAQVAEKRLVLDLGTLGIKLDNIEGMAFGPDQADGRKTLVLVSDNNFDTTQETQFLSFGVTLQATKPLLSAGDVDQDSAVLLALNAATGAVRFQVSTVADFSSLLVDQSVTITSPLIGAKLRLTDGTLAAGTTYFWRATDSLGQTDSASFRTADAPGVRNGFSMGVTGDWRGELAPYPAIKNAATAGLDLFVKLGDTIYADYASPALNIPQAQSLTDYRVKNLEVYSDRAGVNTWTDLQKTTAILSMIDDHEVVNDFAGGAPVPSGQAALYGAGNAAAITSGMLVNDSPLYENGIAAFVGNNAIENRTYPNTGTAPRTDGEPDLYRYSLQGRDAAVFVLDARSFRDAELAAWNGTAADAARFLGQSATPGRTLLGDAQFARLKADLLDANAKGVVWKFVNLPEPIQNFGPLAAQDRYEGYAAERNALLKFIDDNDIENVVFISADVHGTVVNNLTYQVPTASGLGPQIALASFDISTGSVAFDAPFGPVAIQAALAAGLITQAQADFYNTLPVADDADSIPNDKGDFFKQLVNQQLSGLGYDPLGLNANLPQATGLLNAKLLQGDYVAVNTFGWTKFDVDAATGDLTVTTYGVPAYTPATAGSAAVLAATPQVVSQFSVAAARVIEFNLFGVELGTNPATNLFYSVAGGPLQSSRDLTDLTGADLARFRAATGDITFTVADFLSGIAPTPATLRWITPDSAEFALNAAWRSIPALEVTDFTSKTLSLKNWAQVSVTGRPTEALDLTVDGAAAGTITMGSAADVVRIGSANGGITTPWNDFTIDTGDGADQVIFQAPTITLPANNTPGLGTATIRLGGGDDSIRPGAKADIIDGGTGTDTVIYDVARSAATVLQTGFGVWSVTTATGGTDRLTNVEKVQFTDTTLTLTPTIDLSTYVRVGRYDLPEPTCTTAPANNLLAQEVSAVTYNKDTNTLFVLGDGGTAIVQVDLQGKLIDTMTLAPGGSPQNTTFYDPEGLTYVGNGKFVMVEERDRQVVQFTYAPGTTLTRADTQTVKLGTTIGNIGLEGVSDDPLTGGFVFVKEISPSGIFQTNIDFAAGTATNGSPTTVNSTNLFDPALAGLADFADVYALSNLPTANGFAQSANLLILSQESGRIVNIDRSGNIASALTIRTDPGNPLSVADQQHEGLTMGPDGTLYVTSENGGGDFNHPQLWVYRPSEVPNAAPTAVTLTPTTGSVVENTSTVTRLKVADIAVTDDALGDNRISVTGADAPFFETDGVSLYVKAGTILDFETKPRYDVTVTVDDPTVGGTPDATQAFTLTLVDVVNETPQKPALYISEVAPWSSGNSPVAADWFEVTNSSAADIDITGWKMDDNSNSFASAVALTGVTKIAAGSSIIFIETASAATVATFVSTWFGGTLPAGVQIGTYSGSGVGLGTGGDAVNLYNAAGVLQANVVFGVSPATAPFATFDNAAGLNNATISKLTTPVVGGGFVAPGNANEIGSPGTVGRLFVSETAPLSSSSPVGADWFELTNGTADTIDLTGWKIDDNSESPAAAVPLTGVTSIAPGESVIFLETANLAATRTTFLNTWFGNTPPAGLQIGAYTGSGVGLGSSGDAVNIYDTTNVLRAKIVFGAAPAAPAQPTFENAGALNGVTISTLSADGTRGAFTAVNDANEVGSPGIVRQVAPLAIDGTAGPDSLSGIQYGETIRGLGANDVLRGNGGNDTLIGNGGWDVAAFGGARSATAFTYNADGSITAKGPDGTDTLRTIEAARFDSGAPLALRPAGHDLTNDGAVDLLWRNGTSGTLVTYTLDKAGAVAAAPGIANVPTAWRVAATGDLNGDGRADLVWQNSTTGLTTGWLMDGATVIGNRGFGDPGVAWRIEHLADLNGDGNLDIVWRNTSDGAVVTSLLDGSGVPTSVPGIGVVALDWKIVAAADLSGDGKADLVWQNQVTGLTTVFTMNGATITGSLGLGDGGAQWRIQDVADLDGNGTPDVIWRNAVSDEVVGVLLNAAGAATASGSLGFTTPGARFVGTADLNADTKTDILWQKPNGAVEAWVMDGLTLASQLGYAAADADWALLR